MKKLLISLCAVLALVACEKDDANTIKIGAVLPMTGSNAARGESIRVGMETAIKDKGETKYKYKIVFEDGQQQAAKSVSAAQKLISADKVKVLISNTTAVGRAIAPVAESANVLNLNATIEKGDAAPMGKTTFFQGPSVDSMHAKAIHAMKANKVKSVAVIASNFGVSCPGAKALANKLNKDGIRATVECFNPGEREFKPLLDKYKKADAYYISAFPPETDIILRQLYSNNVERSHIYGQGLDASKEHDLHEDVNHIMPTFGKAEFIERVNPEHNLSDMDLTSRAYDLVSMAIDAFEAVGPDNMDGVYEYIRNHATRDCMSGTCKLLPNGFIVNEAEWRTYKDGKPVKIER